jgi:phosphoglycerate dehydrogenase-like enzyme
MVTPVVTRIVCTAPWPIEDALLDVVRRAAPGVDVRAVAVAGGDDVARAAAEAGAEVLYTQLPPSSLEGTPHLRWIQFWTASVDRMRGTSLAEAPLAFTNISGVNARHSAEYVFTSLLMWAGRMPLIGQYWQRREWPDVETRVHAMARVPLRGATLGIAGYGSIGRAVARLAQGFGMRVLATKRTPAERRDVGYTYPGAGDPTGDIPERIYGPALLEEMVGQCDYVALALPSTPDTDGVVGERVLRAMRPHAYLVNVGRGTVVDERALVRALKEGWIGGAGLDVFAREPLPVESELWHLPNAICTPHVSNNTPDYERDSLAFFAENLRRYLDGRPLLNLVDLRRGY